MNIIDLLIIVVFFAYILVEFQHGFLRLCADLIGLIIALYVAFALYLPIADFSVEKGFISALYSKPVSFLAIWFLVQILFFIFSKVISRFTPATIKESKINLFLGIIPAALKAGFFIAVALIMIVVIPLDQKIKSQFANSYLGHKILSYSVKFEGKLEKIFSQSNGGITYLDRQNGQDQTIPLDFTTTFAEVDEEAETILLQKLNEERAKVGIAPLEADILTRNVARTHSQNMLEKGYFSHISQDGRDLADRLIESNASFRTAAENLALAPNAPLAHLGLMNSEKHKANILDPQYTKVGIGVLNAGQYGIMVTQDFIN